MFILGSTFENNHLELAKTGQIPFRNSSLDVTRIITKDPDINTENCLIFQSADAIFEYVAANRKEQ